MNIAKSDIDEFEKAAIEGFMFLESDFGFKYSGLKIVQEDPRDSYVAAKYRSDSLRVDVVWNPLEMSISVFIRLNNYDLDRRKRYLYFEPFIEYMSEGLMKPIVPQIYPGMSVRNIECAMEQRNKCFENGVSQVVKALAEKVREYFRVIDSMTNDDLERYHEWYLVRGQDA